MRTNHTNEWDRFDFDSLADFVREYDRLPHGVRRRNDSAGWTGETAMQSANYARTGGSEARVPEAQAFIDQIEATLPETTGKTWGLDVAGAFPCVPAFLANDPECMWTPRECEGEKNPIRVFVCTIASGGCSHEEIARRGAAMLAFVLLASRQRPVELYAYSHTYGRKGDCVMVVRLQSHPMMLSEVAWVLTSAGWMRNLTFAFAKHHSAFNGDWGRISKRDNYRGGPESRRMLGLEEQDVLVGPVHYNDPCMADPVGFVNRELAKLGIVEAVA